MSIRFSWLIVLLSSTKSLRIFRLLDLLKWLFKITISNIRIQIKTRFPNCNKIFFAHVLSPQKAPLRLVFITFPTALVRVTHQVIHYYSLTKVSCKVENECVLSSLERVHKLAFPLHIFVCSEMWWKTDYLLSVNLSARVSKNYSLLFPIVCFRHFREVGETSGFFLHLLNLIFLLKMPYFEIRMAL